MSPATSRTERNSETIEVAGERPTPVELAREVGDLLVALPWFATAPLLRRWHRRWGATDEEAGSSFFGDELLSDCQYECTRAIEIAAPPERVWPWLVQVGFGRAGFYSYDLLDNVGHPSATRIVPELQDVQVDDWVPMFHKINDTTAFRVAAIEPPHRLLWCKPDSTWAWDLQDDGAGGTRLLTRLRIRYRWTMPAQASFSLLLNELGDWPMMRKMLQEIKRRAESPSVSDG
jgi:hypothetical protein